MIYYTIQYQNTIKHIACYKKYADELELIKSIICDIDADVTEVLRGYYSVETLKEI